MSTLPATSSPKAIAKRSIEYLTYAHLDSTIHTVLIPAGKHYTVTVAVNSELAELSTFAAQANAIAALNGGFFDPANQQTTSFVTINGQLVADPRSNDRLINNPQLSPYLDKILNRSELRRYRCNNAIRYDIVLHSALIPSGCELLDAIGAGPQLLPEITAEQEGFTARQGDRITRDAIGSQQPNARTAVGLLANGDMLWVMVAQDPQKPGRSGLTLEELADFMRSKGAVKALNLDGGSSSALYYEGETHYGKVNSAGEIVRRSVKSVLLVEGSGE